ncbi:MAG: twin-arginine translocation signal domain-containing protein [Magnetococcales bacterium]|nr:twin-arginine translocation signal domain-containing protein [Magnetococcales bacterium]
MSIHSETTLTRRKFLEAVGATGAVCVAAGLIGMPTLTEAADAPAATNIDELIAKELGAGPVALEKVKIDTPPKAENGALVRMPVSVDHPMEADNYIATLAIFVDDNPKPLVGKFDFTPAAGKVEVELRIKMAKASQIRAIAKTNKGKLYGAVMKLEVAEGGCAG